MSALVALVPSSYAVLLIAAAGLALIVQARRLAAGLALAGCGMIVMPALLRPLTAALPTWLGLLFGIGAGLSVARALVRFAIGRTASDHVAGALATDLIRFCLLLPFRLLGGLFTAIFCGRN